MASNLQLNPDKGDQEQNTNNEQDIIVNHWPANVGSLVPREVEHNQPSDSSNAAQVIKSDILSVGSKFVGGDDELSSHGSDNTCDNQSPECPRPPSQLSKNGREDDSPVPQDAGEAKSARFTHLLNPQQADWQHIIPHIQAVLSKSLEIVSYEEWLGELQNSAEQEHDEGNPAVKLIDFFEENGKELKPKFSTAKAQELSKTLATLGPVNGEWIELWMKQWGLDSSRANL